ncbi:hypothetical protein DFH09DRAFT_1304081 [Mycena vulgaris]|nr:hypothetical protein DFH09DRAFT_1304081 [Mycena vulgaris]
MPRALNYSAYSPSASSPGTPSSRGHRRGRIACLNCRKRKIKCVTADDHPHSPCKRCSQYGSPCEFVSVSEEEASSPEPPPPENGAKWLPPLGPESYGRPQKQGAIAITPPEIFDSYAAAEKIYSPDLGSPPILYPESYMYSPDTGSPASLYQESYTQQSPIYSSPHDGGSFDIWDNEALDLWAPSPSIPYFPHMGSAVHYGPFPGPANTIYPWAHQVQSA